MKNLLFVDDEARVLDGLRRMLRSQRTEWECHFAENVDEALAIVERQELDAIVSDVTMPGRSGLDFLRIVRERDETRFLPMLMLTGNGDVSTKRTALELGATDFLNKPFDFIELTVRLQNAIALKQFQDEIRKQNAILEERVALRTQALEQSRRDIIFRLAKAAETRDVDTGTHIIRVGLVSQLLARAMGLDEATQERLLLTAPLHDVGKIGIGDDILRKAGPLTDEQRRRMQEHCRIGAEILSEDLSDFLQRLGDVGENGPHDNELLHSAAKIALCHHERWDGTGYPNGLKGQEIPIEARIVAIADVYDALRSERPYKRELSVEEAKSIIQAGSGSHFDPNVVSHFLAIHPQIESVVEDLRSEAVYNEAA